MTAHDGHVVIENAPTFLTIAEAGERLRVSRQTVVRYLYRGLLVGAVRLPGGQWRIPSAAVDALLGERGER